MSRQDIRNQARAYSKVSKDIHGRLCKLADLLVVEYIQAGGRFTGSEFAKQLAMYAKDGGDLSACVESLLKWLEKEVDQPAGKRA